MDSRELEKTYNPIEAEKHWYNVWENGNYFKAKDRGANQSFSIIMPPPNVTGKLHMGHALDVVCQDALVRFKRMKGFEATWIPGTDHAGIATQSVVEKLLIAKEGKNRHHYGREEFLKHVWSWKKEYGDIISKQQRSLGASPDWKTGMFTMDKGANDVVNHVFVELFNEGLIYQSDYIVNWDTELQSAISDAEVEHEEVKGNFYHLYYTVKETEEKIEIATTRPETMLGDTAVAVNPKDERFKHLIGKTAIVPICNREVKIIGDDYVDIEKGTGCLKVTPGHDFNDFEIGKRHHLEIINILNKDGTLNDYGMQFKGLDVKKARIQIVQHLESIGVLKEIKEHIHQVGHGDRSKTMIEPMVSKQWFLNVQKMAKVGVQQIENENTKFFPKGWENTYFSWLKEPKDWCISRQLWWGHQIPVYTCKSCGHITASIDKVQACSKCNSKEIHQDPDVLDTWFSSGLWPLTLLGWPNKEKMIEKKFDNFYSTSVLVTGYDIIFFWVARMMMMCTKLTNKVPFEKIYIHALVRDKQGRKMSKSLGNGIDPLEMIKDYGADALRFTLAAGSGYNRGLNLDPERIAGYRNFINKIWNAYRFVYPFLSESTNQLPEQSELTHHEKWILSELNDTAKIMNDSIEEFRYDDSCSALYSFIYDKFCSWFIELSKPILYGESSQTRINRINVLKYAFREIVALLHPVSPYITEELWTTLKFENEDLLIVSKYPTYSEAWKFQLDVEQMNKFMETVTVIRNLRASVNVKPKNEASVSIFMDDKSIEKYFTDNLVSFKELAKVKELKIVKKSQKRPLKSVVLATNYAEIFLHLEGVIDLGDQVARLKKELSKAEKEFEKHNRKLQNQNFITSAPSEVIQEVKEKSKNANDKIESIKINIKNLE